MHNVSSITLMKRGLAGLVAALVFAGGAGLLTASVTAQGAPRPTGVGAGLPLPVATSTAVATATPCPIQFTDVPASDPFYAYIRCLACQGILTGYADGTFRPYNNVTRGQTAKIVANAAGYSETPGGPTFADVPASQPFFLWIERTAEHQVVNGYTCGGPGEPCDPQNRPYFHPAADVTRGQLAKIVANAVPFAEPIPPAQQTFADVPPTQPFWQWIERVAGHGAISGYACGGPGEPCDPTQRPYFRPSGTATRGQTAKILSNAFFPTCAAP